MLLFDLSPLLISAALGFFLAIVIARNRPAPGSRALVVLLIGTSLWCLGYALEFISPTLQSKLFWGKFQYFGILTIPLAWFSFSVSYLGAPLWLTRWNRYWAALAVVPVVTFFLIWSNEIHGLVWQQVRLYALGSYQVLGIEHGAWFWVYLAYSYALLLMGSVLMVGGLLGSDRLHRWQIVLALFAALVPLIANLVYITGMNPVAYLDWTPFSFIIAGVLFMISLFRFQLVNILPIAQRTVYAGFADCFLVLDMNDRIVDLNPAAQMKIVTPGEQPFGKSLAQVAPELAHWVSQAGVDEEYQVEFPEGEEPDQHFYDLRVTPLSGPYRRPVGRLIVRHEITQLKQEHRRLERLRAQLEQTVSERTEELRQTVEQLQSELLQRTLAEKQLEEVIEAAPDAILLVDQAGTIILVNARAEQLFGYSRKELLCLNIERLVAVTQLEEYSDYFNQLFDDSAAQQPYFGLTISARRKDGSEFPVEVSLGPLNMAQGVRLACLVRDITERRKAEEEQARLLEQLQQSGEQLSALTNRLQEVQEIERRQIAAELHDRVGQNLTGLNLNLQLVENQLDPESQADLRNRLADSLVLVEETTRQVRDVMSDLHPPVLDEYGLLSALHWYGSKFSQRTGIATRVLGTEFEPRLPPKVEMALFRLVQEALNNSAKHAHATRVVITLESSGDLACLKVKDNGSGFDLEALNAASGQEHWGLITMQQRAASVGGELAIDSAPGQGTQVSIRMRRD